MYYISCRYIIFSHPKDRHTTTVTGDHISQGFPNLRLYARRYRPTPDGSIKERIN